MSIERQGNQGSTSPDTMRIVHWRTYGGGGAGGAECLPDGLQGKKEKGERKEKKGKGKKKKKGKGKKKRKEREKRKKRKEKRKKKRKGRKREEKRKGIKMGKF